MSIIEPSYDTFGYQAREDSSIVQRLFSLREGGEWAIYQYTYREFSRSTGMPTDTKTQGRVGTKYVARNVMRLRVRATAAHNAEHVLIDSNF